MLKVVIAGLFTLALIGGADAQTSCPNRGTVAYCPPGQCGYNSQPWACDKRYCSAKHCPH
jgi:hypothetical protein